MSNVFSRLNQDIKTGNCSRTELVGFVVTLFAFLSHICFLGLFYYLKVWQMFYFNILSVTFFAIQFFIFKKQKSYLPQYIISALEVIAHQACADYFVGVQTGFHYYIILMALIACLELEHHIKLSVLLTAICAACFLAIEIGMMDLSPIYTLPALTIKIIKTVNISLSLIVIVVIVYVFTVTVYKAERTAEQQYERAERLLTNILPKHIVNKLKLNSSHGTIADNYDSVAVLFLDIADFTKFSSTLEAKAIVTILNSLFTRFDEVIDDYHVEKIKTSGDSYIAAAGIPYDDPMRFENIALFALRMQKIVSEFNTMHQADFKIRIGIHCGPVVAGVIGRKKFVYDIWGTTVNFASRMEVTGIIGKIQVSKEMYDKLKEHFILEERPPIPIKNYGMKTNYFLIGSKVTH